MRTPALVQAIGLITKALQHLDIKDNVQKELRNEMVRFISTPNNCIRAVVPFVLNETFNNNQPVDREVHGWINFWPLNMVAVLIQPTDVLVYSGGNHASKTLNVFYSQNYNRFFAAASILDLKVDFPALTKESNLHIGELPGLDTRLEPDNYYIFRGIFEEDFLVN